jgi:hypothetical protein
MRRIAAIAMAAALAGCGSSGAESLPPACIQGPGAFVKALARAPGAVSLGGTPISRCFNRDARGDDEQIVGTNLLAAAQQLSDGGKALQLGYLIGAARRGASRNGLAAELIRRLQQEPTAAMAASGAYQRGLRAGLANG